MPCYAGHAKDVIFRFDCYYAPFVACSRHARALRHLVAADAMFTLDVHAAYAPYAAARRDIIFSLFCYLFISMPISDVDDAVY